MDHRQRSKLSLVTSGLRNFLDYGGGKRVPRKGYVDASLTPIWIALRRDTGYVLWGNNLEQLKVEQLFGIAPNSAWQLRLGDDMEICKAHTDLKGSDPLTKTSLTSNMIKHKTH